MKKEYISPKAEKLIFDYEENIVASGTEPGNLKDGRIGPSANACYTHNGADVSQGCQGIPKD